MLETFSFVSYMIGEATWYCHSIRFLERKCENAAAKTCFSAIFGRDFVDFVRRMVALMIWILNSFICRVCLQILWAT